MKHKIPCYMIQDLLPLYMDGLTGEPTAKDMEEHLNTCEECRASYDRMKADMGQVMDEQRQEAGREIDYLKVLRIRNIRNIICGMAAAAAVIMAVAGVKLFLMGSPSEAYMITYMDVDQEQIHVGGIFQGSASVYGRHKIVRQEDGTQKLVIYACLASGWNRRGAFNVTVDRSEVENQVDIGGATVKSDGTVISKMANELYGAKNPYIGDVSANGRLAGILDMGGEIGGFTSELQTVSEPYGWILHHKDSVRDSAVFESRMRDYGCVMLALIDNLGEIGWTYTVETEQGLAQRQTTLTAQEASEYVGDSVKSFGQSPEKVQELLDRLSL